MRILCAVDGSEYSQWGIQALEAFASREILVLIHIHEDPDVPSKKALPRSLGQLDREDLANRHYRQGHSLKTGPYGRPPTGQPPKMG